MNNQNAVAVLEECKGALDVLPSGMPDPSEEDKIEYQRCEDLLPNDLRTLIQEAKEMKWPFVPERWQYKQAVHPEDKTNLQDMISPRLQELLVYLKAAILVREYATAAAVVFLIDRFLYWVDASRKLLQVAKGLHKQCPSTPIAPQVVIRQARISVNSGKLLKAEYILGSLISNSGATGTWLYAEESHKVLVQSVCIQIRGQILQKLGMWYEAAELIWASIVGFFELPTPDKKGIATSLGILADIFVSMSEDDYRKFKNNPQIDLSLLKEFDHRLLSAAEACKLAATYSLYTPLFVLTNVNIRGTCLLSYSFSNECLVDKRACYLSEAKEAFEIGLLTKKDDDSFASKQELHSFVKAAFCLAIVHKWLSGESDELCEVRQLCSEAMEKLYVYNGLPEKHDKGVFANEIMSLVKSVKERLQVQSFPNSDDRSYVPDSYKDCVKKSIFLGKVSFKTIIELHSQHHTSVCEVFENMCRNHKLKEGLPDAAVCITALKTETRNLDTIATEDSVNPKNETTEAPFSQKSKRDPKSLAGKGKRGLTRSDAVNVSLDAETESDLLDNGKQDGSGKFNQSQISRQSSSSSKSWCNVSQSSTSWEDMGPIAENQMPKPDDVGEIGAIDTQCSTASSEGDKNNLQANNFHALSRKTQHLSLQEAQGEPSNHPSLSLEEKTSLAGHEKVIISSSAGSGSLVEGDVASGSSNLHHSPPSKSRRTTVPSQSSGSEPFEMIDPSAETESVTDSNRGLHAVVEQHVAVGRDDGKVPGILSSEYVTYFGVDPEGETVDTTDDMPHDYHASVNKDVFLKQTSQDAKSVDCSHLLTRKSSASSDKNGSQIITDVDPGADTADGWELVGDNGDRSIEQPPNRGALQQQLSKTERSSSASPLERTSSTRDSFNGCDSTEEDDKLNYILNSSHSSNSSFKSWVRSSRFSSSFSDLESPSFLNSSGSSFVLVPGKSREQILEARTLEDSDYQNLLSGVKHEWLIQRLKDTGIFKPSRLHKAYNALLLKYSKKSGLWTAQETAVYIGDYLTVDKQGKQRNAFWIHFLHQDETLGRYVGKEYKEEKELLYHVSDVERQMTAQYYVTEFNRRLYKLNIPTQVFYLPSSVLLILDGRSIKGCVSVEPYILGEFIKLSNNTKVVRSQYEATKYGMAFGHFTYEFTNHTEIVVDLQGWVTGSEKGEALIYLTDPQIHSLKHRSVSTNFGMKGIHYFFNCQHQECNDICSQLSLTRPSLAKSAKQN